MVGGAGWGTGSGAGSGSGSGCGSGRGGAGVSTSSSQVGTCSTVDSCGSSAGSGAAVVSRSCWRCAASVALKSSASGPSRMLARFRAIEHLLREVAVEVGGVGVGGVGGGGGGGGGGLGVAHGLANLRL